ncbi:MAG: calpain family cysteine protease, partial [archaeon]|nr:calpain family cysteine protease [archaeon]
MNKGHKTKEKGKFSNSEIAKSLLDQNYDDIISQKEKFDDKLFLPDDNSLYSSKSEIEKFKAPEIPQFLLKVMKKKLLSQFALSKTDKNYTWKRLSDLYENAQINVCKEKKGDKDGLTKDVIQGDLGDGYFLSALNALAEKPERIKYLFPNQKITESGVYEAEVYLHGEATPIVVDDYFPVIEKEGSKPQFAFAGLNENTFNIWPMVLEKIWAKCNNSYEDIIPGNCADAFEFLSPAPIDTYIHSADTSKLFETIEDASKKNYIILADITEIENKKLEDFSKMGLITNHAYSVIGTTILKDDEKKTETKLLKLKNIWGTNEWHGDWSDGSKLWTEKNKNKVGLVEKEDGIFWICFEDYIKFYTSTHICRIHDGYKLNSQKFKANQDNAFTFVCVNVPRCTSGFFEVNFKNKRIYSNLKGLPDFENPYCHLTVFYKDGNKIKFVGGDSGIKDRLYVPCEDMVKGLYYIGVSFPKQNREFKISDANEHEDFKKMSFRVGVYSPLDKVNFKEVTEEEFKYIKNFMDDIITDMALKNKNKYFFEKEGAKDSFRVIHFDDDKLGFGYIYYDNKSDAFIKEQMTIFEMDNLNIIPILKEGEFQKLDLTNENEVEFEDPNVQKDINNLRDNTELKSSIEVTKPIRTYNAISEDTPLVLCLKIAPHSKGIIILQKTDEESVIDFYSDICLDYLIDTLLSGRIFHSKKYMLKYNDKPVDIYEIVTEHNTGAVFQ